MPRQRTGRWGVCVIFLLDVIGVAAQNQQPPIDSLPGGGALWQRGEQQVPGRESSAVAGVSQSVGTAPAASEGGRVVQDVEHGIDPSFFATPPLVVEQLARTSAIARSSSAHPAAAAAPRHLSEVETQNVDDWQFPAGTTLMAYSGLFELAFGAGVKSATELVLLAGYAYTGFEVEGPNEDTQFGVQHFGATIKLQNSEVTRYDCHTSSFNMPMMMTDNEETASPPLIPSALDSGSTLSMIPFEERMWVEVEFPHIKFMRAGQYKLCYNPDGGFTTGDWETKNNVIPVVINIIGVDSGCLTTGCMSYERWHCFSAYRGEASGPCQIDVSDAGKPGWSLNIAGASSVSWSSVWPRDQLILEDFIPAEPVECANTIFGSALARDSFHYDPDELPTTAGLPIDLTTAMSFPGPGPKVNDSWTVSACYCPNYDSPTDVDEIPCNHLSEYIQPLGGVHVWMIRLCSVEGWFSCGVGGPGINGPWLRVLPEQPFVIRLQCPPGGVCKGDTDNALKFIPILEESGKFEMLGGQEYPSWHFLHRCANEKVEITNFTWVGAPADGPNSGGTGGTRRDYKAWTERPLMLTRSLGTTFDVCYCDENCDDHANFIKVGVITTAADVGIAKQSREDDPPDATSVAFPPIRTIEFTFVPGSITLFGGEVTPMTESKLPYDFVPFSRSGIAKLISFDREANQATADPTVYVTLEASLGLDHADISTGRSGLDAACAAAPYDAGLIQGPSTAQLAKDYMAVVISGERSQYYAFDGATNDQEMTASKTGILSICYCAIMDDFDLCAEPQYWMHVARLMIRGPRGDITQKFPTNTVVRLELDGWGFDPTDKLRLLTQSQLCLESDFNPTGVTDYKRGCPGINKTGCARPDQFEDIEVVVDSANSTGIYITALEIDVFNSSLVFSAPVTEYLQEGDMITIEEASILLEGLHDHEWTAAERDIVSKISGIVPYPDDDTMTRQLPVKLSYVYEASGTLDPSRMSIPVGWRVGQQPLLTFADGRGRWQKRSRLRTEEEFLVTRSAVFKICWGVNEDGVIKYYGEGGWAEFYEPELMADAGVHLTARRFGARAPVVISFSPEYDKAVYSAYDEPMVIRFLFHDVDKLLDPLQVTPPGEIDSAMLLEDFEELSSAEATQAVCGRLFSEMWVNHDEGFPMPRGCYYGQKYMDADVVAEQSAGATTSIDDTPGARYREIFIVFESRQGLRSRCYDYRRRQWTYCVYQLVMDAQIMDGWVYPDNLNRDAVSIYTSCERRADGSNPCGGRYDIFEYGKGRPSYLGSEKDPAIPTLGHVDVTAYGRLENYTGPHLDWELVPDYLEDLTARRMFGIDIRAFPTEVANPIERRMFFRLFFFPLTMWELSTQVNCFADCIPAAGKNCTTMGATLGCEVIPTVFTSFESAVSMPKNMIKTRYPLSMDLINSTATESAPGTPIDAHIMRISDLVLPDQGFFTRPFLAVLTDMYDLNPSEVYTQQYMFHRPIAGITSARLLMAGPTGNGDNPFTRDLNNELVVRMTIGVTLNHFTDVPSRLIQQVIDNSDNGTDVAELEALELPPVIELTAPFGYENSVVGDGEADPDGTLQWFQFDNNADGFLDYYMNVPRTTGSWSANGRTVSFTFADNAVLFVGQVIYTKMSLNNPSFELFRDNPANVWYLTYRGSFNMTLEDPTRFLTLEEEAEYPGWVGNVAVIGKLRDVSLQPSTFVPADMNDLWVFFAPVRAMKWESHIVIDSPYGFDFGPECVVANLTEEYYLDYEGLAWGEEPVGERAVTRKLPGGILSCHGEQWGRSVFDGPPTSNFTRAVLKVRKNLEAGAVYGFNLRVHNAYEYAPEQHESWKMWIESPERYTEDGTKYSILFNFERVNTLPSSPYDNSWALYSQATEGVEVNFEAASMLPTSVTIMKSMATVYPLQVSFDGFLMDMRVTAPPGWVWEVENDGDYRDHVPGVTCDFNCYLYTTPSIYVNNELVFTNIVMRRFENYGFQINMRVPERPPTRFANYFYVEVGFTGSETITRLAAGKADPPSLRVIYNAYIFSLCNIADYRENTFEFHMNTRNEVGLTGGFVFRGDVNTQYSTFICDPTPAAGSLPFPSRFECSFFVDFPNGLPVIILAVHEEPFPPGKYGFRFHPSRNYPERQFVAGIWSVGTYNDVHIYPNIKPIDMAAPAPAPLFVDEMQYANHLNMPEYIAASYDRDDRPNALNGLIFYVRLRFRQTFPETEPDIAIAVRAPDGFQFEYDCFRHLHVLDTSNASNATNPWPCARHGDPLPYWCPDYIDPWPEEHMPMKCLGLGNTARISIPNVVWNPGITYGFQLYVTNPFEGDVDMKWAVDFGTDASRPFSSFKIRTFDLSTSSLTAVPTVVSLPDTETFPTLVIVHFTPTITIPGPGEDATERGSIALVAPDGFLWATTTGDICDGAELERAGTLEGDVEAVFKLSTTSPSADAACTVNGTRLEIVLVSDKSMVTGTQYRITAFIRHPETPQDPLRWTLLSYKTNLETGQTITLDSIEFPGYLISNSLQEFIVDNGSGEFRGLARVRTVQVSIRFTSMVRSGDIIVVYSPPDFHMVEDDGTTCLDFRWPDAVRPFPYTGDPTCTCTGVIWGGCELRFVLYEPEALEGIVLVAGSMVSLNISVVNPVQTPDIVDNYWRVEHQLVDGNYAFLATTGWFVFAQIPHVSLTTTGGTIRAGSVGELMLRFTPDAWGSIIDLTAVEPTGFDLTLAVVSAKYTPDARTLGNRLVFSGGDFPAGVESSVSIKQVRMGDVGGPVAIHLRLFRDTRMRDQDKTAQRLFARDGIFQLPGALDVLDQRLWSSTAVQHFEMGSHDSVKPLIPPHAFDLARVEIIFTMSISAEVGERLVIQSQFDEEIAPFEPINSYGYEPRVDECVHFGGPTGDGQPPWPYGAPTTCNETRAVHMEASLIFDTLGTTAYGLSFLLDEAGPTGMAVNASLAYRLMFWCRPSLDEIKWHITTEAGGDLPTNTNDKLTDAAGAVAFMPISVTVPGGRSPTGAIVFVDFNVQAGDGQKDFVALEILMPPGFCAADNPQDLDPYGSVRAVTRLILTAPQIVEATSPGGLDFVLEVLAPPVLGEDWRWFVIATRGSTGIYRGINSLEDQTGWGEAPGFRVGPLPVTFAYAPVPEFTGWLKVAFEVPEAFNSQFAIILAPELFTLICPPADSAGPWLDGPCRIQEPQGRTANLTLSGGELEGGNIIYSFLIGFTSGSVDFDFPPTSIWDFQIQDRRSITIDAAYNMQGLNFVDMVVLTPTMSWDTELTAGEEATVTVEMSLTRRVTARAVLISMPEGYKSVILHPNQLKSLNKNFPVALNVEWREYFNVRWVRLLVEPGETPDTDFIPAGTFQFQFPVEVALLPPLHAEWYLSLCSSYNCEWPMDSQTIVSFPIPNTAPIADPLVILPSAGLASKLSVPSVAVSGFVFLVALTQGMGMSL